MKGFRPRFTVRTLTIFVTMVGIYFGAWEVSKKYGFDNRKYWGNGIPSTGCEIPFVVWDDQLDGGIVTRQYYFWFFGFTAKLPFESHLSAEESRAWIAFPS